MQKVVVVGAGGRLGKAIARQWAARGLNVTAMDRKMLPLGDLDQLGSVVNALDFDTLINCAALTNVDYCEKNREEAFLINAEAPRVLAEACSRKSAHFVHISTDYVFDGLKKSPYAEEDPPHPVSVYGESKLGGEQAVLGTNSSHWVVRVSWVFGPDRPSFVDQILERALRESVVSAVCDKWATPTYTLDAEEALFALIRKERGGGVLHLSNSGGCSWQEYGQWALDCAREAGVELAATRVDPIRMADLAAFIAVRPPYTVLSCERFASLCGVHLRGWKDAVRHHVRAWLAAKAAAPKGDNPDATTRRESGV